MAEAGNREQFAHALQHGDGDCLLIRHAADDSRSYDARPSLPPGVTVFPGAIDTTSIYEAVAAIYAIAPPQRMPTRRGFMSAEITNCGIFGWISDARGYRYSRHNPATGQAWPPMPEVFRSAVAGVVAAADLPPFDPDACLINRYGDGAKMGLHQDRDERDTSAPVVSFSLGRPGIFAIIPAGKRTGARTRLLLRDGDALVLHGPGRLLYHGIERILPAENGENYRINLTFRRAR